MVSAMENVDVWHFNLDSNPRVETKLESQLSSEEHTRADRFHFAHDRRRFIIRRGLLRQLLGSYLGADPEAIDFLNGTHGKPAIAGNAGGLCFNCSHSGGLGLIAVAQNREIGVDIEEHRPMDDQLAIAASFFSPVEYAALCQLDAAYQSAAFFDCWTRKEALVKALGQGLSYPLNQFSVSIAPGGPAVILELAASVTPKRGWSLTALEMPSGYSAALVVEGAAFSVRRQELICRF